MWEIEDSNIRHCISWLDPYQKNNAKAAQLYNAFGAAAATLLTRQFPANEAIAWLEAARDAAARLDKKYDRWGHLANLGNLYTLRGDNEKAIVCYEECLQIVEELGEQALRGKGVILGQLGTVFFAQARFDEALKYFDEQLAIARKFEDSQQISSALGNLGRAYRAKGELTEARKNLQEALAITRKTSDRHGEGLALGSLGQIYFELQDYAKAIECHKQYLQLARATGDRQHEITALGSLAHAFHASGNTEKAIECSESAVKAALEMNNRREQARALGTLGYFYHSQGDFEAAIAKYNGGLGIAKEIGDQQYLVSAWSGLGQAYMALKKYQEAFDVLKPLYEHYWQLKDRRQQGLTLYNCSICAANLGDAKKAVEFAEASVRMLVHVDDPNVKNARKLLAQLRSQT